jgi:hypothetical protein
LVAFGIVSASTIRYIVRGFDGAMAISRRPSVLAGSPPPVTRVHVRPASALFHSPEPGPPERRKWGPRTRSQLAAHTTSGFDGSSSTSTKPAAGPTSLTRCHVRPPSAVLYSPRSPPARHAGPSAAT